jgi:hypothetical protein
MTLCPLGLQGNLSPLGLGGGNLLEIVSPWIALAVIASPAGVAILASNSTTAVSPAPATNAVLAGSDAVLAMPSSASNAVIQVPR